MHIVGPFRMEDALTVEQNKAVLRRLFDEVMNGGKVAVLDEISAPDFMIESPVIPREGGFVPRSVFRFALHHRAHRWREGKCGS